MRVLTSIAVSTVLVLAAATPAAAQQQQNNRVVTNNTVINNMGGYRAPNWNGSYGNYGGYQRGWNNGVGMWPGSGPYDSAIAVTGIAAGATVLNTLIGAVTQPRVVVQQQPVYQPNVVVQQPVVVQQQPVYGMATSNGCIQTPAGMDPYGRTVYTMVCQ